jgi:hypothetical protein
VASNDFAFEEIVKRASDLQQAFELAQTGFGDRRRGT